MVVRVGISLEGYNRVMRKLRKDELLAGPWVTAMRQVEGIARAAWMGVAPRGETGMLRASITTKIQAKPIPKWVRIKTTATRSSRNYRRYRYPARQEYDPKSRNRGKLTAALQRAMGRVQSVLDQAARAIEARWRS